MVLSEQQRRWSEIKFYYYCMDIYNINKDMIEVILLIEAIAHIGKLDYKILKNAAAKMLSDPYYLPIRDEVISLADAYGLNVSEISKQTGISRKTVRNVIDSPDRNTIHNPTPLLDISEDKEIYNFNQIANTIRKAGIHEKETKDGIPKAQKSNGKTA